MSSFSPIKKSRPFSAREIQKEQELESHKWSIMFDKADAHKSPINAITNLDYNLYSGANKSIKVWDIKTM